MYEVKGPGARGVTPVLAPGGEWSYESGTSLSTAFGSMHGTITIIIIIIIITIVIFTIVIIIIITIRFSN